MIRIGLIGNPNSGKTTIFNALTGTQQDVGNWPGVTVAKKEGRIGKDILITDLPGIYSLSPYSKEEVITRDYLLSHQVDVIINLVDATNLERNLYLTTQVLEMSIPTIVALNMMDEVAKRQIKIDVKRLAQLLHCPVVPISAKKNQGLKDLINQAVLLAKEKNVSQLVIYPLELAFTLDKIKSETKSSLFTAVKLFEGDQSFNEQGKKVKEIIASYLAKQQDDGESIIANERYRFSEQVVSQVLIKKPQQTKSLSAKIDSVLTHKIWALPIFALIMFIIYYTAITVVGNNVSGLMEQLLTALKTWVSQRLTAINSPLWLIDLFTNGIIGGVGSVLSFLPQLFVLFLLLTILEDSGYMARVAFIMDRMFRRFGLSGKSFIPLLLGTGCSVPAIMSTRTISNESERKMTVMLVPFIPCSAKLPVFALFVGTFFHPLVSTSLYFIGIAVVLCGGLLLKKIPSFKGDTSPFILELVDYHLPNLKSLFLQVWERTKSFLIKAGTIIFLASIVIWFLSSYTWSLQMVIDPASSMLAAIGRLLAWIFVPLGFGNWQSTVALLAGMIAKENIVSTFGIVLNSSESLPALMAAIAKLFSHSQAAAFSFMVFVLLAAPCVAAIATSKKELGSWKLTLASVLMQTGSAYLISLAIYQLASWWIKSDAFKIGVVITILVLMVVWTVVFLWRNRKKAPCLACHHSDCERCFLKKK
ncbi:MAG TPA: ferrous iron transport protein B [Bacilli bacterium]|nr:MAG: Ferrous iron transport protein B [Tenericutes bacterium ADurb.BinA124]HNZ50801.1 ferrous iron transport protein B [Bacilli bacterium]HPX83755.1 ferrous iron transport protein B [Bacilli bacterium]HQC73942.1 ferrous iron transport protein B [Bacilli bacterium]